MQNDLTPASPDNEILSRRHFVGAAGLAGLGLLAAQNTYGQTPTVSARAKSPLFSVPMNDEGEYELPKLPYPYDSLEPSIDAETMRLHHDIHFNGYKNGLNAALAKLAEFRAKGDFPQVAYWENQLAFHGAGYNLHVVFFQNMAPAGTTSPGKALTGLMDKHFGGLDAFKAQFSAAARTVQGSGWAILGYQPMGEKLVVMQAEKHQDMTMWAVIPILALDVWEHAYYLKYQNRRGDYIANWWNVVNWDNVTERATAAMALS
ncbi:MAG: superoxide dismutase [Verrucomicrobiota bacterium]